jgi:hypothetical protein
VRAQRNFCCCVHAEQAFIASDEGVGYHMERVYEVQNKAVRLEFGGMAV